MCDHAVPLGQPRHGDPRTGAHRRLFEMTGDLQALIGHIGVKTDVGQATPE
ncbi:hypothetical protein [Novispirillum itersonii]|uniref:hypothetical protein n=1 Tax=Novispirillum itersonii TaxID=189 RepID=UPI00035E2BFF|nr:hypothetical protein [Novispirillum itersonii]